MLQNPALSKIGTFVVQIATSMLIIIVTAAKRVSSPRINSTPHTISQTPTKGAKISGFGIPILVKRPTPCASGIKNFWMPSERKTPPTIRRIRITAAGAFVESNFWKKVMVKFPRRATLLADSQQHDNAVHQMISGSSAGVSSSNPSSQRTGSLLPPEQTHWNVNSMSSLEPDTLPAPAQYGQDGSLAIKLPSTPFSY